MERMTNTSKYTGSHKDRFDESGPGKGLQGRDAPARDAGSQQGYVGGYKGEGSYDKK